MEELRPRPDKLGPLSARVFEVLGAHTAFPWPILLAQCKRVNVDPTDLGKDELRLVLPHLVTGVARFTSPENGESTRNALEQLL